VSLECLGIAEEVISSSTIQANRVIPQVVEDFIHLEESWKCFDQDSGLDASPFNSCHLLRFLKHTVPYLSLPANNLDHK